MALAALLTLSLLLFSLSTKNTTLTQAQCLPEQRDALIQLKQDFNTTELHSWNMSTDCCIWDGVTCDEQTGMLTALNLADRHISGELNPALFNLSSLQYINLSENYYYNITLPQTGFDRLGNLTHLNLSYSGFAGQVPIGFSALTNHITLNLSNDMYNTNPLYLHNIGLKTLLSNFTRLKVLRLGGVDISLNGSEWGKAVFQVGPTLQVLSMADCGLRGNLPDEIFHLTNLTELDLDDNSMISGQLPVFTKERSLQHLSLLTLYNCSFHGEVLPSITNLTRLEFLDLRSNRLTEFAHLHQLQSLDLSCNQLSGHIPEELTSLAFLSALNLSYNNMFGEIPQDQQFSTFSNESYLGNPGLCGSPLSIQCATTPSNDEFNKDLPSKSSTYIIGLSISTGLGLGVGFASVIWALVSWEDAREHLNFIVDRIYFQHILWIILHLRLAICRE